TGTIGFLNVVLGEDPAVTPNQGIKLGGTFTVNLADPDGDGKILFNEFGLNLFQADISGKLDIDGLKISANIGTSTLGAIQIAIDGDSGPSAPGQITGLPGDHGLAGVLSRLSITGETAFDDFNNLTPDMILAALDRLITQLSNLGAGGVFHQPLPLINKSLA